MGSIPTGRSNVGVWPSGYGTWFGTRRSVVRIHLPRPTQRQEVRNGMLRFRYLIQGSVFAGAAAYGYAQTISG